jgi:DNA-binding transcriptional LysR family regulator
MCICRPRWRFVAAGRLGLGLIPLPRYHVESDLEQGTLVSVLPDFPPLADTGLAALSSEPGSFTACPLEPLPRHQPSAR